MNKLIILLKKDFIDGIRNLEVMIVVLIPLLLSILMGLTFSSAEISLPKIAILSNDQNGQKLFSKLLFKEIIEIENIKKGKKLLEKGKVDGIIIIPKGIKKSKSYQLRVILDDSSISKTMMIKTIVKKTLENYFNVSIPIDLKFENYRGLTPKQRMLPMWILMGIFMIGLTVLPMSISTEKEKKTLDALLLTSVTEKVFLFSKLLWATLLMSINTIILLYFNDGMGGNWIGLIPILLTGIFASTGIGLFIAMISPTQVISSMISTFVLIIMVLSSSLGEISEKAENIVSFLPSYHLSKGFQESALFDKGISFVWQHALIMFIWGAFFLILSFIKLHKREG